MASSRKAQLDLNLASESDLVHQLKIQPRLAKRIAMMRPYHQVADLGRVWGMDPDTLARILPLVCVSGEASQVEAGGGAAIQPSARPQEGMPGPAVRQETAPVEIFAEQAPAPAPKAPRAPRQIPWTTVVVLGAILLIGAYFRFNNVNWDQNQHQHPDERFLTMVAERIQPVSTWEYFNTQISKLNPMQDNANYTYGMFPLFVTRMVGGWLSMTHYDKVVLVGRVLSGLFDLGAVFLLYFLGKKLFSRRVGFLAAALSAAAVLQIQLSHYFTVDSFAPVFIVAAFLMTYQAVPILDPDGSVSRRDWYSYAAFGLIAGTAMACKMNVIAIAAIIVLAAGGFLLSTWNRKAVRWASAKIILIGLGISAVAAFIAFRIFQPYAFMGPGFFGLSLNPRWMEIMKEITGYVAGNSDWPPNDHWTSRPTLYAWSNMVTWGLGLPLGLAAWGALVYAIWRCFKGEWRKLILPVAWVAGYFIWQNVQFWRYMRYFVPIYPIIILLAAWGLFVLLDRTRASREKMWAAFRTQKPREWNLLAIGPGMLVALTCVVVVGGTYLYAFAFSSIYTRPLTRVAASQWMLQNIQGPLNVIVESGQKSQSYPIAAPHDLSFSAGDSYHSAFKPIQAGTISQVAAYRTSLALADLRVKIKLDDEPDNTLSEAHIVIPAENAPDTLTLDLREVTLQAGKTYRMEFTLKTGGPVSISDAVLRNENDGDPNQPLDWSVTMNAQGPGTTEDKVVFTPGSDVRINRLAIGKFSGTLVPTPVTFNVSVTRDDGGQDVVATTSTTQNYTGDEQTAAPVFRFDAATVDKGKTYYVNYQIVAGGPVVFDAETYTLETSWDDSLPLRVEPYDGLGGIYDPLNLELYDDETPDKRAKMEEVLDQANYIVMPSNRGYDAMPRLPQRYPMATSLYQGLFDCNCSGDQLEEKAYGLNAPFHSPLGYDLVATFTSAPTFGPFRFADESADESFTVYDHPKVLIFKKSADYSSEKMHAMLDAIDLSQVVRQQPIDVSRNPNGYRIPADRLAAQQAGGTWAEMFSFGSLINSQPGVAAVALYLLVFLLGGMFFPLTFVVFRFLPDRGYTLARLVSLLLIAWVAWMLASFKIAPFSVWTILGTLAAFIALNALLLRRYKGEMLGFLRERWRYIAGVEALFAALFVFSLVQRLGNPDLWNPWYGGEKPMDFSILNAVLKTVYFPSPNPWFAGYYLNYYYYGYVVAAIPIKLIGIAPSIAYNLVLPTWFGLTGIAAFSIPYNIVAAFGTDKEGEAEPTAARTSKIGRWAWIAGVLAVVMMLLLGNLYEVRQLWRYLPEASAQGNSSDLGGVERLGAVISGAQQVISGQAELPGSGGRWFFDASRPILNGVKDTPIVEFPYFTYLYGDMHPHMLSTPFLFLALAWMLALLLSVKNKLKLGEQIAFWITGGLILGFFRPAHTWDYPTLLGMSVLVIAWTTWKREGGVNARAIGIFLAKTAVIAALSLGFYAAYSQWFVTAYSSVDLWTGLRTPLKDYLTVHALFLFVLIGALTLMSGAWIRDFYQRWKEAPLGWMAEQKTLIKVLGVAMVIVIAANLLWTFDFQVFVLAVPLLAWIAILILKGGRSMLERLVLVLFGIGLCLTLLVELVTLKGDDGRSNTVFYFYYQVWSLFSVAAGVGIVLVLRSWRELRLGWKAAWSVGLAVLVLASAVYPLTATPQKLSERWPGVANPPHVLDGMAFMLGEAGVQPSGAVYNDDEKKINLAADYEGIRFMLEHVKGTPTIVEAQTTEYRWGSRYSVYTGLPAVVGWSWHVRQHLDLMDGAVVEKRIDEVKNFYTTTDLSQAAAFLKKYSVSYVIVGEPERAIYGTDGMAKFDEMANQGALTRVFQSSGSQSPLAIYQVTGS